MNLFGIRVDPLSMREAVDVVLGWIDGPGESRYVVTPNVDHLVILEDDSEFRRSYEDAGLVLIDGKPVLAAARLLGSSVPGTVPGSDLVPALFEAANCRGSVSVFLLGAAPGVAERAASHIEETWPKLNVVGTLSPPYGFEKDAAESERIITAVNDVSPDILVVGLGAPKQEIWVHRYRTRLDARAILCVGATIDFIAGEKKRAPEWMQRMGFEWLFRMLSEPRRLVKRYGKDAIVFPGIVWREWRRRAG